MTENEKRYFETDEKLRTVGSSFLVSYLYQKKIEPSHTNWRQANTNNLNTIINNKKYWAIWIEAIVHKNPGTLGQKNELSSS